MVDTANAPMEATVASNEGAKPSEMYDQYWSGMHIWEVAKSIHMDADAGQVFFVQPA